LLGGLVCVFGLCVLLLVGVVLDPPWFFVWQCLFVVALVCGYYTVRRCHSVWVLPLYGCVQRVNASAWCVGWLVDVMLWLMLCVDWLVLWLGVGVGRWLLGLDSVGVFCTRCCLAQCGGFSVIVNISHLVCFLCLAVLWVAVWFLFVVF